MEPKPHHLSPEYGAQFADPSVVRAYAARPPYPPPLFDALEALLPSGPRHVLELGCGTGDLTLDLAARVDRLDAVEPAAEMVRVAQRRALGSRQNIRWNVSTAEAFAYEGSYAMVVAAESLHWMDWSVVLPAIARSLAGDAVLAIVGRGLEALEWQTGLSGLIGEYSTNRDYRPYDIVDELTRRGLFREIGRVQTPAVEFSQSVDEYVESFHSRNGFSRDRMSPEAAAAFDAGVRALVAPHCPGSVVRAMLRALVVWGRP